MEKIFCEFIARLDLVGIFQNEYPKRVEQIWTNIGALVYCSDLAILTGF